MATTHKKTSSLLVLLGLALALMWPGNAVRAQEAEQLRNEANAGTVRVLAAGVDTAHMLHELAATLNKTGSLRILPIMGGGGIQNVIDTLYLRGIDMALVRYDMLDLLRAQKTYGTIEKRIRYVTKLFDEEIHVVARREITSVEQLAGLRVNYGDPGSGTFERADRIFRTLGVGAIPVSYSTSQALEKVRSGEIAATVHVGPRPSPFVRQFDADDGVHLLAVPLISGLEDLYKRASLDHKDYPDLIPQGQSISTLSVETFLAVYNWPKKNERSIKVDTFVTTFFDRLAEVQQPDRHPKWREVALLTEVKGLAPSQGGAGLGHCQCGQATGPERTGDRRGGEAAQAPVRGLPELPAPVEGPRAAAPGPTAAATRKQREPDLDKRRQPAARRAVHGLPALAGAENRVGAIGAADRPRAVCTV